MLKKKKSIRLAPMLYTLARRTNTVEALLSGNRSRIARRMKNIVLGRLMARSGVLRRLWG